jgi:hypothetical protein
MSDAPAAAAAGGVCADADAQPNKTQVATSAGTESLIESSLSIDLVIAHEFECLSGEPYHGDPSAALFF